MSPHLMTYAIMVPLLALLIWRRVRRQFGRQPIRRKRMMARVLLFSVIAAVLAVSSLHNLRLTEGLLGGVLLGGGLGVLGIRLTRFEADPKRGDCYVPNVWIGAVLTALLLGRLAYRFLALWPELQHASALTPSDGSNFSMGYASSPLTMLVIGMLVGYYIVYYSSVLIHHRRFLQSHPAAAAVHNT